MIDLTDYGFSPAMLPEDASGIPARVTAVHRGRYELVCMHGECFGRLKSSVYYEEGVADFPTTGDFVLIRFNENGDSQIIGTLERRSFFSRRDPGPVPKEQAVAANFDYVFIMQSLNQNFNVKRLERYLTLAWQSGSFPVVVLTKADLVDDVSEHVRSAEKAAVGVGVYPVSAFTGYGIDKLSDYLSPRKTIVFLGSSGVGKSSLVNALAGDEIMAAGEIRREDGRGRHTTTHRQLIKLNNGVMVIDTPGMRELGMWDVSSGLGEAFDDVEQYFGHCKFSNCKHQGEPGCAVNAAIESGELPRRRWESYLQIRREAEFSDDKLGYLRQKQQRNKEIAKWNRQRKMK